MSSRYHEGKILTWYFLGWKLCASVNYYHYNNEFFAQFQLCSSLWNWEVLSAQWSSGGYCKFSTAFGFQLHCTDTWLGGKTPLKKDLWVSTQSSCLSVGHYYRALYRPAHQFKCGSDRMSGRALGYPTSDATVLGNFPADILIYIENCQNISPI